MTNIRRILENNGFSITKINGGYELSQYTPAGEDWSITVNHLKDIKDYEFDAEEEFAMWMEARHNGFSGVPSPHELWEDQLWKQELLDKIATEIK